MIGDVQPHVPGLDLDGAGPKGTHVFVQRPSDAGDLGFGDLPPGGAALARLERVDLSNFDPRIAQVEVAVACDVDNPLLSERGASVVYGPQKGASENDVAVLDRIHTRFADVVENTVGRRMRYEPGAGAMGGLGFGLMAFCEANPQATAARLERTAARLAHLLDLGVNFTVR